MNTENAKQQMRKGVLELCILSVIAEQTAYPSDILRRLKAADMLVVEGTLYPLLTRLKNAGLLQYVWQESTMGPPRKYFQLTPAGDAALAEQRAAWAELVSSVQLLLSAAPPPDDHTNNDEANNDEANNDATD